MDGNWLQNTRIFLISFNLDLYFKNDWFFKNRDLSFLFGLVRIAWQYHFIMPHALTWQDLSWWRGTLIQSCMAKGGPTLSHQWLRLWHNRVATSGDIEVCGLSLTQHACFCHMCCRLVDDWTSRCSSPLPSPGIPSHGSQCTSVVGTTLCCLVGKFHRCFAS